MPSFIIKCTKFNQSRSKKQNKTKRNVTNMRNIYRVSVQVNLNKTTRDLNASRCKHGNVKKGNVVLQPWLDIQCGGEKNACMQFTTFFFGTVRFTHSLWKIMKCYAGVVPMVRAPLGNSRQTGKKKKLTQVFFQSGNKNQKLNVHTCMRFSRISYVKLLKLLKWYDHNFRLEI